MTQLPHRLSFLHHRLSHPGRRRPGQGLVEFALILPILLLILFGIIEFARILQAWLSVENGARFGVRYAVTGEYDPKYCPQASVDFPAYAADDAADGVVDCIVPSSITAYQAETDTLKDAARIYSIAEVATAGAVAILRNPDGSLAETDHGYFKVTVCSTRDLDGDGIADYQKLAPIPGQFLSTMCVRDPDGSKNPQPFPVREDGLETMDSGGPGDRVVVSVDFNHPVIVPLISSVWPKLHLTSLRLGIVERFRTARVVGLPPLLVPPTPTNPPATATVPSSTPTNTSTSTNTPTPTSTSTSTNTSTATPTPTVTQTGTRTNTPTTTQTRTITPTPTQTRTPTTTSTSTWTPTITQTPTRTLTPTITRTPTRTPTPTITRTPTRTPTITRTPTRTRTPTITRTPTRTRTPTITRTPTRTPTRTSTPTPTATTPSPTPTRTRTPTATTPSPTPTRTSTPTPTRTITPTRTSTPNFTATPTRTRTPTLPPTLTPTRTLTPCFDGC